MMTLALPEKFVLFDTEYTSWEGAMERGWSGPGEHKEVVELGAVTISIVDLGEESSFKRFVKPVKNPLLSEYLIRLTGITQEVIKREGVSLAKALEAFSAYVGSVPVYSYGHDIEVVRENCALLGIPCTLNPAQFTDIRPILAPLLAERGVDPTPYTSGTLIQAFGVSASRAHDAVNDMRNLLEVLRELRKR